MPPSATAIASASRAWRGSPTTSGASRKTHTTPLYWRKTALAAVVHLVATTKVVRQAAQQALAAKKPGPRPASFGRKSRKRATAAVAERQAAIFKGGSAIALMPMPPSDQRRAAPATWRTPRRSALRGCERIPSRRRAADASLRAALLLLAIAPGYASPISIRGALRGGRLGHPARSGDSFTTSHSTVTLFARLRGWSTSVPR